MIKLTVVKHLPPTADKMACVQHSPTRLPQGLGYVVTNHCHFNLLLLAKDYKLGTANLG